MVKPIWIPLIAIVIMSLLITNCAVVQKDTWIQATSTITNPIETVTEQIFEKQTPLPILSQTPVITLTSLPTPQPTFTSSPDTRMTQGKNNLLKFISQCSEPCLWGIVPNKTGLLDAKKILEDAGLTFQPTTTNHYFTSFRIRGNLGADVVMRVDSTLITGVRIMITGIDRLEANSADWVGYSLANIFKVYGIPTKIGVLVDHPHEPPYDTGKAFIDYILFYENQNIIMDYSGGAIEDAKDYYQFCPGKVIPQEIRIWYGNDPETGLEPYRMLGIDAVSSLSTEDFYKIVLENYQNACIDLKVSSFQN